MLATHFSRQPLALPGAHYSTRGRFCASSDYGLGTYLTASWRDKHRRRHVLRGLLVADTGCAHGRLDLPTGTYHDFVTVFGGDDGLQRVSVRCCKSIRYAGRRRRKGHGGGVAPHA